MQSQGGLDPEVATSPPREDGGPTDIGTEASSRTQALEIRIRRDAVDPQIASDVVPEENVELWVPRAYARPSRDDNRFYEPPYWMLEPNRVDAQRWLARRRELRAYMALASVAGVTAGSFMMLGAPFSDIDPSYCVERANCVDMRRFLLATGATTFIVGVIGVGIVGRMMVVHHREGKRRLAPYLSGLRF